MLDKIYVSVGPTYESDSSLSTKYLGLEVINNQLKQVEYECINGKYPRWDKGVVSLKAELSAYNSKVVGNFYDEEGQEISDLYISDIIDGDIALSGILPKYFNMKYEDHIRAISGDILTNLRPSSSDTIVGCAACLGITILCILIIVLGFRAIM